MNAPLLHKIKGQNFWFSHMRAVFWEEKKALILSDLHLGKTGHFRKAGIAIPQTILKEDMQRLFDIVQFFKAERMIVVGDFFHSLANLELNFFTRWRQPLENLQITLVKGNHDILKDQWYASAGIEILEDELCIDKFCFTHDPGDIKEADFTFYGHVHPGIVLSGRGQQALRLPCFYLTDSYCILPAFGKFTGLANIHPKKNDNVFAIAGDSLIKL